MKTEVQERAERILKDLVEQLGEGYYVGDGMGINKEGIGTILMISELMSRGTKPPTPTGKLYISVFWSARAHLFHERADGTFRDGLGGFIKGRVAHMEQWCAGRNQEVQQ